MEKKIIELITISERDRAEFNRLVLLAVKNGYQPYGEVKVTATPPVYGSDGRFNTGAVCYLTQQFARYEADNSENIKVNLFDLIVADEFVLEGKRHKVSFYDKSNPTERLIRAMCLEDLKNYSFVENINEPIMVDKLNSASK